ncbi:MAG: hypothetical protein HND39_12925 [Ignavibacteriota bacterium]|nr:hypothetical protein [Ignavibacteriales bacterium]MBL1121415.1 hypothetical protein [Ignavibacteriota bacterium]MCE7857535.1 hypothetical protein [Ignavibacteria bacterium CHB3]MEB2297189.1 hypothetical protein [Ignavibacteria bacterium]QKJ97114.1 MAG: hypothetical protein HND39_12925 [Ignavibacteriota bacterium]
MRTFIILTLLAFFFIGNEISAQIENVPLTHPVYIFLKEMKVKKIIPYINEDVPNLSRFQVKIYLQIVEEKLESLSATEIKLLNRYKAEFYELTDINNSTYFFHPENNFLTSLSETFSDKVKYIYAYSGENANVFLNLLGHYYYGQQFRPSINNAHLFDIGFRFHGTLFNHLGYNMAVIKGGAAGNKQVAELIDPRIKQTFKWVEDAENIGNYEFVDGYIKYLTNPVDDMNLFIEIGREYKTVGYGYGSKLVLSGDSPPLDFIEFGLNYGIASFSSIHGSTVGDFSYNMDERYTKYWAFNRLKFSFENLFDIGIGENIIYSGRGFELGYASPLAFYKFVEMELQDRDNANLYFDIQTSFIPNLELQGTFFLDENILSNLQNFDSYKNKTAYQLGIFWYEALSLNDLSMKLEYTKIRPFVYTHVNAQNTYSSWGTNLGHPIGPNADEIFSELAYNLNDWMRVTLNYRFVRKGENLYDEQGNLIKNVGGDINVSTGPNPEFENAYFLDGERFNQNIFQVGFRIEPIRDFIFYLIYNYDQENNLATGNKLITNYGLFKFQIGY